MLNVLQKRKFIHRNLNEFNKQNQTFTKITTVTSKPLPASFEVAYRIVKCEIRLEKC